MRYFHLKSLPYFHLNFSIYYETDEINWAVVNFQLMQFWVFPPQKKSKNSPTAAPSSIFKLCINFNQYIMNEQAFIYWNFISIDMNITAHSFIIMMEKWIACFCLYFHDEYNEILVNQVKKYCTKCEYDDHHHFQWSTLIKSFTGVFNYTEIICNIEFEMWEKKHPIKQCILYWDNERRLGTRYGHMYTIVIYFIGLTLFKM